MRASPPQDGGESHMEPKTQEEREAMVEKTSAQKLLDKSRKMRKRKIKFIDKS